MKLVYMFHEIRVFRECASAVFANKHFGASFSETKLMHNSVYPGEVRFERATLSKRLVTSATFERLYSRVRSYVALEIERIIEAFCAELAVIALVEGMGLHMAIKQTLQRERTVADLTFVLCFIAVYSVFPFVVLVL